MYNLVDLRNQIAQWEELHSPLTGQDMVLWDVLWDLMALQDLTLMATVFAVDGHGNMRVDIPDIATLIVSRDAIAEEVLLIDIDGLCAPREQD